MSFKAKRLRVQVPCGPTTVFEQDYDAEAARLDCFSEVTFFCDPNTCVAGENSAIGTSGCGPFETDLPVGCGAVSEEPVCSGGSEEPIDPRTAVIDADFLPQLRELLEARLADVAAAEQALARRQPE